MGAESNISPLVSVIVPVYNVEKYLVRCLDSIIGQTYQNLEIILVNDGSTDKSGEICREYAQSDPRIRVLTQENKGLSAARNAGLDNMEGEYIVFVDSDDYISPCMVEILLGELLRRQAPIVICNFLVVEDGEDYALLDMVKGDEPYPSQRMTRDEVFDTMGTEFGARFQCAWGKIYEKRIFKSLGYEVGKIYEDSLIYHKIYAQVEWVYYVDLKLCAYRMSANSITRKNGSEYRVIDVLMEVWLGRLKFFQQYGIEKYVRCTEERLFSELVFYMTVDDSIPKRRARQHMKEAESKAYQITGRRFFSWRCMLFKISPKIYRFVRNSYKKIGI